MKAFIHIGFDKTGSTSIQSSLAASAEELRGQGLFYPISVVPGFASLRDHTSLTSLLVSEDLIPNEVTRPFGSSEAAFFFCLDWLERMKDKCAAPGGGDLVLSSEAFYSLPFYGVVNLRKLLRRYSFDDFSIIAFVDSASGRFRGQTAQRVVTRQYVKPPHPQDIRHYLENYAKVFGRGAVRIIDYQDTRRRGTTVQEIFDWIGADRTKKEVELRENASLSAEALALIQRLDAMNSLCGFQHRGHMLQKVALLDFRIGTRARLKLLSEVVDWIDRASPDYRWLHEEYGFPPCIAVDDPGLVTDSGRIPDLFHFDCARYELMVQAIADTPETGRQLMDLC